MNNMIIGLGNTGTNIVKAAIKSPLLEDTKMYVIDSVTSSIDLSTINRLNVIPIISDEKAGSGRNRERGKAMYEFHESNGAFNEMYETAANSKSPVLVITSAAGGTGSGSVVPLCKTLIENKIPVIPIIVCPNEQDPAAFHLNTSDLFIELGEVGVDTYSVFVNKRGDADYDPINNDVVKLIEILFGKKYDKTKLDSIDDSDLDVILSKPGRLVAVSAQSQSSSELGKLITHKIFSGFQPAWNDEEIKGLLMFTAISMKSMFANTEYKSVFADINSRLNDDSYDEFRHIVEDENNGICEATMIVAGLPRPAIKEVNMEYNEAKGIGEGIKKPIRPNFINRKKAVITEEKSENGDDVFKRFGWKMK